MHRGFNFTIIFQLLEGLVRVSRRYYLLRRIAQIDVELLARYWNRSLISISHNGLSLRVQLSFRLRCDSDVRAFIRIATRNGLQVELLENVTLYNDWHRRLNRRKSNEHLQVFLVDLAQFVHALISLELCQVASVFSPWQVFELVTNSTLDIL